MKQFVVEIFSHNDPKTPKRHIVDAGKKILIGRSYGCGIIVDDPYVSEEHVSVSVREGFFIIEDLKSDNGTCVRTKKNIIRGESCEIESGQIFSIGKTKARVLSSLHKMEPTVKNDWTRKTQECLGRPVMASVLLAFSVLFSIFTSYIGFYGQDFWVDNALSMILGIPIAILSVSALAALSEYMQKRKSVFFIFVSYVSLSFVGMELFLLLDKYFSFYLMSYALEKAVFFILSSILAVMAIMFIAYVDERKISKTAWVSSAILVVIIALVNYGEEMGYYGGRTDYVARYSNALPRSDWQPSQSLSVDDFINTAGKAFDIKMPVSDKK